MDWEGAVYSDRARIDGDLSIAIIKMRVRSMVWDVNTEWREASETRQGVVAVDVGDVRVESKVASKGPGKKDGPVDS